MTDKGIGGDIINSYGIGAGTAETSQTRLAIEFYKSVAAKLGQDPYEANISVTGHSAGGGLAGLVGAIYGKQGVLFDDRAFQAAVNDNKRPDGIPMYSLRKSKNPASAGFFLLGDYDAKRLWFGQAFNLCRGSKRLMRSFGFILNLYGYLKKEWIMLKQTLFLLVVGLMSLSMASCAGAGGFSNEKIRYKMTVTVETPEGIKTGSAVREAARYTEPSILPEQGGAFYNITKGEAVVVDLGQRGVLFALLGDEREAVEVFKAFHGKDGNVERLNIEPSRYPKLVHFKDASDPKTVEKVLYPDLEAVYGHGVRLSKIEIVKTSENVTYNIHPYLPWIPSFYNQMLDGKRFNTIKSDYPFANSLNSGAFKIGDNQ